MIIVKNIAFYGKEKYNEIKKFICDLYGSTYAYIYRLRQ